MVRLTGEIICDQGRRFRIVATVNQGDTAGQGVVTGTCTGASQRFRVVVTATSGPGFESGTAGVEANAQIGSPATGTIEDTFSTTEDVGITVH